MLDLYWRPKGPQGSEVLALGGCGSSGSGDLMPGEAVAALIPVNSCLSVAD